MENGARMKAGAQEDRVAKDRDTLEAVRRELEREARNREATHAILTRAGVPDAAGAPCDDPACTSHLTHRVLALVAERNDLLARLTTAPTLAPAFKVGDRVTAENVEALPVGTEIRDHDFPGWSASKRKSGKWHSAGGLRWEQDDICADNTYIHSLPTPEKP